MSAIYPPNLDKAVVANSITGTLPGGVFVNWDTNSLSYTNTDLKICLYTCVHIKTIH